MRQTLHIFRKDVRALWPQIIIVFLLMTAHAVFDNRSSPVYTVETGRDNTIANLVALLLPLGMWVLTALLVLEEALPGDKQDWLTRPYQRSRLLAAKVLFILVFINIPFFVSDCYLLAAKHFAVASVLPQILLHQLPLTSLYVLPFFAIATLTATLAQFFFACFCVVLALFAETIVVHSFQGTSGMEVSLVAGPVLLIVLTIGATAIFLWQYRSRQTVKARIAAVCFVIAFFPALSGLSRIGGHTREPAPFNAAGIHVSYVSGSSPRFEQKKGRGLSVKIPLTVEGLPPETLLRGGGLVTIHSGGSEWPHGGSKFPASVEKSGNRYWQSIFLSNSLFPGPTRQVNLHTAWKFEVVTDHVQQIWPLSTGRLVIGNSILCQVIHVPGDGSADLACQAGLNPFSEIDLIPASAAAFSPNWLRLAPPQLVWGLSPVSNLGTMSFEEGPASQKIVVTPRHKVAAFSQSMDISNIHLADYAR